LGAQLAAHCTRILHQDDTPVNLLPKRLVLLDPWFTGNFQHAGMTIRKAAGRFQPYLFNCEPLNTTRSFGNIARDSTLQAVKALWKQGIATELYKGSTLSITHIFGDPVKELETLTAYVVQKVNKGYCHGNNVDCGHSSLVPLYMLRLGDPQPLVESGNPVGNCTMPGPACSNEQIRVFIQRNNQLIDQTGKRKVWHQKKGIDTIRTDDDSYRVSDDGVETNAHLPQLSEISGSRGPANFLKRTLLRPASSMGVLCFSIAFIICAGMTCALRLKKTSPMPETHSRNYWHSQRSPRENGFLPFEFTEEAVARE
jgi:hypothetical protein